MPEVIPYWVDDFFRWWGRTTTRNMAYNIFRSPRSLDSAFSFGVLDGQFASHGEEHLLVTFSSVHF